MYSSHGNPSGGLQQQQPLSPWVAAIIVGALIAAVVPLVVLLIADDGAGGNLVERTLPLVRVLVHLTSLCAIAFLSAAAFLPQHVGSEALTTAARRLSIQGSTAGLAAVAACVLLLVGSYFNVLGTGPLQGAGFEDFSAFLNQFTSARALMAQMGLLLAGACLALFARSILPLRMALFLIVAASTTMALGGHSASQGGHDLAMFSMAAHIAAASLWVGGLSGLGLLAKRTPELLGGAVARFSRLALICAAVVGLSGVVNALLRVEDVSTLPRSLYGLVLLLKVLAFIVLIAFGALHRRRLGERGPFTIKHFLQLAAGELVVMGVAYGLATALVGLDPPP